MDRAKRIREMREGSRDGDDEASSSDATDENRTDGGDPEKQTMEDIVEATDGEPAAERSDDSGDTDAEGTAAVDDTPAESVEAADTPTETAGDTDTAAQSAGDSVAETSGNTPADDDTAGTASREGSATEQADAGTGAQESVPTMGESEPTAAETGSTADIDEGEASEDEGTAGADAGAADEGGVSAPLPEMDELEQALEGSATADPETVSAGMADSGGGGATAAQVGADAGPADAGTQTADTPGASAAGDEETTEEEETRVLEFTLDDEHYCLDIQYIEEIVKHENITRVPNTPPHVEGVVDLRGQITTILNPKVTIGKENQEAGELIVVFDAEAFEDQGYIGWVVDDVRQVSPIVESEVNDPPMAEDYINGVIDREDDDEFVIWTSPDLAFEDED
jgi:purine-binding chemotaxis protein CheW